MREITQHRTGLDDLDAFIRVEPLDDDKPDGANNKYQVLLRVYNEWQPKLRVDFQNGAYRPYHDPVAGVEKPAIPNGVTIEALLAICIDRLNGFQRGKFACRENAVAITHMETALLFLQKRTRDRVARGVEGTLNK
jgi:hypothetical protein